MSNLENSQGYRASEGPILCCRYCLEEDGEHGMIMPCNCRGTQSWIHRGCLDRWRSTGELRFHRCEICLYNYEYEEQSVGMCKIPLRIIKFMVCIWADIMIALGAITCLGLIWVGVTYPTGLGKTIGIIIGYSTLNGTILFVGLMIVIDCLVGVLAFGVKDFARFIKRRYTQHRLYSEINCYIVANRALSLPMVPIIVLGEGNSI